MKLTFLGVGEACDENHPNTSLLCQWSRERDEIHVLLDCGFSVPHAFFGRVKDPDALDYVWISHFHGDHFFGLPLLFLRFWECDRRRTLTVVTQPDGFHWVRKAMELAYPGFWERIRFPVTSVELEPGKDVELSGVLWRVAPTEHGRPCLAVRLDGGGTSLFYSGDGRPTPETRRLAQGCDLAVHEAFHLEDQAVSGHGTVVGCLDWAKRSGVHRLALVHVQRDVRRENEGRIRSILAKDRDVDAFLPRSGHVITVGSGDPTLSG